MSKNNPRTRSLVLAGGLAVIYACLVFTAVIAVFRNENLTAISCAFLALIFCVTSSATSRAATKQAKK